MEVILYRKYKYIYLLLKKLQLKIYDFIKIDYLALDGVEVEAALACNSDKGWACLLLLRLPPPSKLFGVSAALRPNKDPCVL